MFKRIMNWDAPVWTQLLLYINPICFLILIYDIDITIGGLRIEPTGLALVVWLVSPLVTSWIFGHTIKVKKIDESEDG